MKRGSIEDVECSRNKAITYHVQQNTGEIKVCKIDSYNFRRLSRGRSY